jgi:hypothetical protein
MKTQIRGRLRVEFTTDPDTPVMVYAQHRGRFVASGTYHCVADNGFIEVELTDGEMEWLATLEEAATEHYDAHRVLS